MWQTKLALFLSEYGIKLILGLTVMLACFLTGVKVDSWRWNAKHQAYVAKVEKERAEVMAAARDMEQKLTLQKDEVEREYAGKVDQIKRSLAAANADRDRLRDLVAAFNAGVPATAAAAGGADGASPADRLLAESAGLASQSVELVAAADRLADETTQAAELCRAQLTALQQYVQRVLAH